MRFWTERGLLGGLRKGDSAAACEFVRRYQPTIYRYALSMTRSREDAEDIALVTITSAVNAIGDFRGNSSISTWLHSIAYREVLRRGERPRLSLGLDEAVICADPFSGLDAVITVLDALQAIGAEFRETFLLREVQGLSTKDAATVLGVSQGTVKWRLHESKRMLRIALAAQEESIEVTH